jgi:hypothetical protein
MRGRSSPTGLLLMHISNRYLDLEPVLAVGARKGGWHAAVYNHRKTVRYLNDHPSVWVAMSAGPRDPRAAAGRKRSSADVAAA